MKYTANPDVARLELTRRNLVTLLAKLDDPLSARTLVKADDDEVWRCIHVTAVEDDAHYSDRAPGEVYMPSAHVVDRGE